MISRRRWGYVVWSVALGFVFVPEILAALPLTESQLPFPTISRTMGHLEYVHAEWEILPTALIVLAVYSLWRVPPRARDRERGPHRTPGGRLTFDAYANDPSAYESEILRDVWFALRALAVALVVTGATLLAYHEWPNEYVGGHKLPNYRVAYVLYGSIGLFWIALPTLWSIARGRDAEFPTLIRTLMNLEDSIARHGRAGRAGAWLLSFVLLWGMVFLMLHLTLYPFPNITHVLNPGG
jgi:hypothetical protein